MSYIVELTVKLTVKWPHADDHMDAIQSASDFIKDIYNHDEDDAMLDDSDMPMVLGASVLGGSAESVAF